MYFKREIFNKLYFSEGNIPILQCPTCYSGLLQIEKEIINRETSNTQCWKKSEGFDEFDYSSKFVAILKCNNVLCNEVVIASGTGSHEVDGVIESIYGEFDQTSLHFTPEYFTPPLHIIPINDNYPKKLQIALKDSFKVFFIDNESCANKIRIIIEIILDQFRIPKTVITRKKKKDTILLHKRIEIFKTNKSQDIGNLLLSVKWIGNYGSHNEKLSKDDILDAYSILERALTLLYDQAVMDLSKRINKIKKPLSKSTRHKNPF